MPPPGMPKPTPAGLTPSSDGAQTALIAYIDELQHLKSLPEGSPEHDEVEERLDELWSMIHGGDEESPANGHDQGGESEKSDYGNDDDEATGIMKANGPSQMMALPKLPTAPTSPVSGDSGGPPNEPEQPAEWTQTPEQSRPKDPTPKPLGIGGTIRVYAK